MEARREQVLTMERAVQEHQKLLHRLEIEREQSIARERDRETKAKAGGGVEGGLNDNFFAACNTPGSTPTATRSQRSCSRVRAVKSSSSEASGDPPTPNAPDENENKKYN